MSVGAPNKTFEAEKNRATFSRGAVLYVLAGLLFGIVTTFGLMATEGLAGLDGTENAIWIITWPMGYLISALIGSAIVHGLCKLLNGEGAFVQLFYLNSLYAPLFALVSALATLHPFLVLGVSGTLFFWSIFLQYRAVRVAHHLSRLRSAIVVVVPGFLMVVLAVVLVMVFAIFTNLGSLAQLPL